MGMKASSELLVAIGLASKTGRRPDNQDFVGAYQGGSAERVTHGVTAVLADGVSGAKGGRIAAELVCRSFIDAYYSLPETLGVAVAAERALSGFNRWLHGIASADPNMSGAATTFSALVLRGRYAHALHVGDSRIWRYRDGELVQLTTDHTLAQPELSHVLYRAVGIEQTVRLDHAVLPLEAHDRFLITSDGVHGALSHQDLQQLLDQRGAPEGDAAAIVNAALAAGSSDNASAIVADITALPDPDHDGIAALAADLAVLPAPVQGDSVDGFKLEQLLADGEQSRTFLARSGEAAYVLKFPKPGAVSDHAAREGFVREMLIGGKISSPYLAEVVALSPEQQSRLYLAMPYYAGETLDVRLRRGPLPYAAGLALAVMLAKAVAALHRLGVVHRDIKPENVLLETGGGLRLLDLGAARLPHMDETASADVPGSQGYLAAELYRGSRGTPESDQFALGVTLYRMFTGALPYTDLASLHHPGFDSAADPAKLRSDMPAWLAMALRRSVQALPEDRFGDVIELQLTLEKGSARAAPRPPPQPLLRRDPVLLWRLISLLLGVGLIAALLWR